MKTLLEFPSKTLVKIISISGGKGARKSLGQLGISIGSHIKIVRNAPFAGPILIENQGATVAIGRGMAVKIFVEEL